MSDSPEPAAQLAVLAPSRARAPDALAVAATADRTVARPLGAARLPVALLALSFATFLFLGLLALYAADGVSEHEEGMIFVLGWALIPVMTVAAARLFMRARRRWFPASGAVFPVLLSAHAVFWVVAIHVLRHTLPPYGPSLGRTLQLFVLVNVAAGISCRLAGPSLERWCGRGDVSGAVDLALPLAAGAFLLPFFNRPFPQFAWLVVAAAGLCSFLHADIEAFAGGRRTRRLFDALVLLSLALLVVDPGLGHWLQHDANSELHYNFYLGPVAAIVSGKSPLVDVNCQYGVGVLYFIALAIRSHLVAPSVGGMGLIVDALVALEFIAIYALLRHVLRSAAMAAVTLFVIVFLSHCAIRESPLVYPSAGPLRFLPGYLLLTLVAARGRLPRFRRPLLALELVTLAIASVWSFESFLYVVGAYLGVTLYEGLSDGLSRRGMVALLRRFANACASVALAHLVLVLLTYARSGELPHWSRYFDYIRLYSTKEFGAMLVDTWTSWPLVLGVYVASVVVVGCRFAEAWRTDGSTERAVVFGMTTYGIVQFTYFVGRSHPNNLLIICPPAVFVASYWFVAALRRKGTLSAPFRASIAYVGYALLGLLVVSVAPDVIARYDNTLFRYLAADLAPPRYASTPKAVAAAELIRASAADHARIGLFMEPNLTVETLLLAGKGDIWPLSYPDQDELIPAVLERALAFPHGLKEGDVIFVSVDGEKNPSSGIDKTHRAILQTLQRGFALSPETCLPGFCAFRLRKVSS